MESNNTLDILIRNAILNDIHSLSELCSSTFYDTYHLQNTPENMDKYIQDHFGVDQLQQLLSDPAIIIFVVELKEKLIGYIQLDIINSELIPAKMGIEISRFYVDKNFQKLKLGKKLMNKALDYAFLRKYNYVWLGVWQKNIRAIEFYQRAGFEIKGMKTFILGDDAQEDFIMIRKLEYEN